MGVSGPGRTEPGQLEGGRKLESRAANTREDGGGVGGGVGNGDDEHTCPRRLGRESGNPAEMLQQVPAWWRESALSHDV